MIMIMIMIMMMMMMMMMMIIIIIIITIIIVSLLIMHWFSYVQNSFWRHSPNQLWLQTLFYGYKPVRSLPSSNLSFFKSSHCLKIPTGGEFLLFEKLRKETECLKIELF